MNISPTNNSQPSFKGVIIPENIIRHAPESLVISASPDGKIVRPLTSVVFRIVRDAKLKGIQFREKHFDSKFADALTEIFFRGTFRQSVAAWYPEIKRFGNRALIKQMIEELKLKDEDKKPLFHFLANAKRSIKYTNGEDFELVFSEKAKELSF